MAPLRRRGRQGSRRWNRGHNGGRVDRPGEDTIAGESVRRVLDSYCPYCATDIRSMGPRRLISCPNIALCGKILPVDDNCCPSCCHYTRPTDNFCRVCRANLRGVVRGRGALYQQLRRAPSPVNNASPPREEENAVEEYNEDSDLEDNGENIEFVLLSGSDEEEEEDPVDGEHEEDNVNHEEDGNEEVADPPEYQEQAPIVDDDPPLLVQPDPNRRPERHLHELRQFLDF